MRRDMPKETNKESKSRLTDSQKAELLLAQVQQGFQAMAQIVSMNRNRIVVLETQFAELKKEIKELSGRISSRET